VKSTCRGSGGVLAGGRGAAGGDDGEGVSLGRDNHGEGRGL